MRQIALLPRSRIVLGMVIVIMAGSPRLAAPAWPLDTPEARASLIGISQVRVQVVPPDAKSDGLAKEQLQADVESRLQQAGITLAPMTLATAPVLWVLLTVDKVPGLAFYAASIRVELFQYVRVSRNEVGLGAPTWGLEGIGSVSVDDPAELRSWAREYVDRFINAYLEQNPKP
jgi:hypothetical protein